MPAVACIPPKVLKCILELDGFTVRHEDDYNWAMMKDDVLEIVIVPKHGDLVALDVLMNALDAAQMNNVKYFDLLDKAR